MQNGLTNLSGELAKKKCDLWSDICSIVFIAKAIKISISAKPNILALNLLEWGVIRTRSKCSAQHSKALRETRHTPTSKLKNGPRRALKSQLIRAISLW